MIDILLISDQSRLHAILTASGKLPDGSLRIASSLHQGLELMSSKAPDILFLQNRLSGLAGYILVRHVREETGSASTKIVLLTEGADGSENSSADIELLTGVSDNELSDAVSEIIADQLDNPQSQPAAPVNSEVKAPLEPVPLVPDVTDTVSLSNPGIPAGSSPATTETLSAKPSDSTVKPEEPGNQATILSSNPPPIQWERKRLGAAMGITATLAVAILLAVFFLRTDHSKKTPKATPAKTPAPTLAKAVQAAISSRSGQPAPQVKPVEVALPSFIPAKSADSKYSAANPGWERYTSAEREYKIFREAGNMKAIQVLGKSPSGIPPAFFTSTIKEIANVRDYRTGSREQKGDFLIKKGKLSKSADIIIYKNRSDTLLRAFVVTFNNQESTPDSKGHK